MRTPLLCFLLLVAAAGEPPATVEVRGLSVVGAGHGDGGFGGELRPMNSFPGTRIALLVLLPGGGLVGIDRDAITVKTATDDQGTDLLASPPGSSSFRALRRHRGLGAQIAKDGKAALVDLDFDPVPAAGARTLTVTGSIVVQVATAKQRQQLETVAAKEGQALAFPGFPCRISKVDGTTLTIAADRAFDVVAGWTFSGPDGKPIEHDRRGSSFTDGGSTVTADQTFRLKAMPATLTIAVDLWTDRHPVTIPFTIATGVGLR